MENITYRVILVVGDNHEEIVKKYSGDTVDNEKAFYKYERCQQHRLEVTGEEGDFSDPFPLKDGAISYSAHYNDIDWDKIHLNPYSIELSGRVWELIIENDEPHNDKEKEIKDRLSKRTSYFTDNFKSKEEYVQYYSSLWYYGIAQENSYNEVNTDDDDLVINWCVNFFDRFIKPLESENPLLTIYEVHSLD